MNIQVPHVSNGITSAFAGDADFAAAAAGDCDAPAVADVGDAV